MKLYNIFLTAAFAALFCQGADAQIVDRVITTNGSLYEGYISSQQIGEGLTVRTVNNLDIDIPIDDVDMIEYIPTAPDNSMGTLDVLVTNMGHRKGQIVRQKIGQYIQMKTKSGDIFNVDYNDVKSELKEPLNTAVGICYQVPYLSVVVTADGREYTGVITTKTYGGESSFVKVTDKDGRTTKVMFDNITEIQKIKNKDFSTMVIPNIVRDEVYIEEAPHALDFSYIDNGEVILGGTCSTTLNAEALNGTLHITAPKSASGEVFKLVEVSSRQVGYDNVRTIYYFNHNNIASVSAECTAEGESATGNSSLSFAVAPGRTYAVYRESDGAYVLCNIQ